MRLHSLTLIALVFSALAAFSASAQDDDEQENASPPVETGSSPAVPMVASDPMAARIQPFFGRGFASDDGLRSALGALTFSVTACENKYIGPPERKVQIRSEKVDYSNPAVVDLLLVKAAEFAWRTCPLHELFLQTELPELKYEVSSVDLYLPDGTHAVSAYGLQKNFGGSYNWGSVALQPTYVGAVMANQISVPTGNGVTRSTVQPRADDQTLVNVFGYIHFSMSSCSDGSRTVRIDADRYALQAPGSQFAPAEVVRRAILYAWQQCLLGNSSRDAYIVDSASIYLPDGQEAYRADGLTMRVEQGIIMNPLGGTPQTAIYEWGNLYDILRQNVLAREQAQSALESDRFWSLLNEIFWLTVFGFIAVWILSKGDVILRWYYYLTPHPAEGMVNAAIESGHELDGKAFANIMRPVPGGRIEKQVRAEQARNLAQRAQHHAAASRVEADRIKAAEADRIKARAQRDTDFINAQEALAKAANVHEQAKARLEALRKRVGQ